MSTMSTPPRKTTGKLAVLATIPGREAALEKCLASLRPQVDHLFVICHDFAEPPECVKRYATWFSCESDRLGSAAKLRFSRSHSGLYLGCDDDLEYPPDYVATMLRWVKRWKGRALVVIGGRTFKGNASEYPASAKLNGLPVGSNYGEWVNYPNAAGLAFDTRLNVPSVIPEKNQEEAYLAIWAQDHSVPIWLVPKTAGWITWLLDSKNPGPTIWESEKQRSHPERNRLIAPIAARGWRLRQSAGSSFPPSDEPFAGYASPLLELMDSPPEPVSESAEQPQVVERVAEQEAPPVSISEPLGDIEITDEITDEIEDGAAPPPEPPAHPIPPVPETEPATDEPTDEPAPEQPGTGSDSLGSQ